MRAIQYTNQVQGNNAELGKNWDYLGSIHSIYMLMMSSFRDYAASRFRGERPKYEFDLRSNMMTYTYMVYTEFKKWLEKNQKQNKISFDDYKNLIKVDSGIDEEKLVQMFELLIHWSQAEGIFKLLVEKNDPHKFLQQG